MANGRRIIIATTLFFLIISASAKIVAEDVSINENPAIPELSKTSGLLDQPEQKEIVVTGDAVRDALKNPLLESPGLRTSFSEIDRAAILAQGALTVVDAVEYAPSVWIETRGRKVRQFVSLRGQKYPYPQYALDGAWQREFEEMPFFFHADNIEKIEVMRSSNALLIGPGGMTGTINIIPRTYKETETSLRAEWGSYNTSSVHLDHGGLVGKTSYSLGFGNRHKDGPTGENESETMSDAFVRVSHPVTSQLDVAVSAFGLFGRHELEQAEPPATTNLQNELSRWDPYRAHTIIGKARYERSDKTSTELVASYAARNHQYIGETTTSATPTTRKDHDYETTMNATHSMALGASQILRFGALFNHWIVPDGKRFYTGRRCDLDTYALFSVWEADIDDLSLHAGYKMARTWINEFGGFGIEGAQPNSLKTIEPIKNQWDEPLHNLSAGLAWRVTRTESLHAALALGTLAPRTGALTSDLTAPETETRFKLDAGLRFKDATSELTMTLFATKRWNASALTGGSVVNADGDTVELYMNRNEDQFGVEFDGRHRSGDLTLFFNWAIFRNRVEDGGSMVFDREAPMMTAAAGVSYAWSRWDVNAFIKSVGAYENDRFLPSGSDPATLGDYAVGNVNAGWRFGEKNRNRLYVSFENIGNVKYSTVNGYPDDGIKYAAGTMIKF